MELLSPAGNLSKLKTAVLYGANAVYLAGQKFSLRGASENFSESELIEGVSFAKEKNCKIYVTLNAFLYDKELDELKDYLKILEHCGIDAVIVSDLGVMEVVRQDSKMPIHLSTQASCLNVQSAKLWKNLGVKRIILGREVSLDDAMKIRKFANIEVELFIHGSLCMSYSGNCIISNYTAGRDSNRGGCIQSCRFAYSVSPDESEFDNSDQKIQSDSILSSKDLRGIELLPRFIEAGIDSIKIEGRMKSSLYLATTTSAYSQALNFRKNASQKEFIEKLGELSKMLEKMPHRGYTEGSLKKEPDAKSIYNGGRNSTNSEYEFAGTVMEVEEKKFFTILAQNSIDNFSTLEILNFEGKVIEISTNKMETISNNQVFNSKPNRLIRFPYPSSFLNFQDRSLINSFIQPLNVVRIKKSST